MVNDNAYLEYLTLNILYIKQNIEIIIKNKCGNHHYIIYILKYPICISIYEQHMNLIFPNSFYIPTLLLFFHVAIILAFGCK